MNRKLVLIDDDPDMLALTRLMLSRQGFEIVEAHDGNQGLATVQQAKPDVVLLDLMLPDIDGWEVCRRLKADPQTKDIPVLIISARPKPKTGQVDVEIAGYISKPFQSTHLVASINAALNGKDADH